MGGGAIGQRGDLLVRARLPQAAQQPGHGVGVVEGETWAAARCSSAVTCSCAPASRRLPSSLATASGSSRETWAAARSASAVTCSCAPASRRLSQQPGHGVRVVEGDVGGGIAAQQRGDLLLRARLPQPVQQPGHVARVVEGDVGGGIAVAAAR